MKRLLLAVIMMALGTLACFTFRSGQPSSPVLPATRLAPTIPPSDPSIPDITGEYSVQGTGLSGNPYDGSVTLVREQGDHYSVVWNIKGQLQYGRGTFDGKVLDLIWEVSEEYRGTATYTLQPDGSLVGTWTEDGEPGEGTEVFTPK